MDKISAPIFFVKEVDSNLLFHKCFVLKFSSKKFKERKNKYLFDLGILFLVKYILRR